MISSKGGWIEPINKSLSSIASELAQLVSNAEKTKKANDYRDAAVNADSLYTKLTQKYLEKEKV